MSYRCSTYSGSSDKDLAELRARVSSEIRIYISALLDTRRNLDNGPTLKSQILAWNEARPHSFCVKNELASMTEL